MANPFNFVLSPQSTSGTAEYCYSAYLTSRGSLQAYQADFDAIIAEKPSLPEGYVQGSSDWNNYVASLNSWNVDFLNAQSDLATAQANFDASLVALKNSFGIDTEYDFNSWILGEWVRLYVSKGDITAVVIGNSGGSGYLVNDVVSIAATTESAASFRVTAVDGSGVVAGLFIVSGGWAYVAPLTNAATTGGTGEGLTITATNIRPINYNWVGFYPRTKTILISPAQPSNQFPNV